MAFRLLLLMAMGLGAMYMLHLLAQDYNIIRQPVAAARAVLQASISANAIRSKRYATSVGLAANRRIFIYHRRPQRNTESLQRNITLNIDWKRILSRDPFECLQSLICQIMSGAESDTAEAINLMDFLEATLLVAPAKIGRAFSRGLALHGFTERCYDEYPFCIYSAKTMLRVLRWFAETTQLDGE